MSGYNRTLTGARTTWAYCWEDPGAYAQEPGEPNDSGNWKAFGDNEDISEPELTNNEEEFTRPFNREPSTYLEMQAEGSWGTDFVFTNPFWLSYVYGNPQNVTDNGDGTYDLTYQYDSEAPPRTAHLVKQVHYANGDISQTIYIGVGADSVDFSTSVQDPLDVSVSGYYATERYYENVVDSPAGELSDQPDTDFRPLNFANASLFMDLDDDGTPERKGAVQDLDVTFNSDSEPDFELGSRFPSTTSFLLINPELSYTARITGDTRSEERKSVYGTAGTLNASADAQPAEELSEADIKGAVTLESRKEQNLLDVEFSEAFPSSHTPAGLGDPESQLDDEVDRNITDLTITATIGQDPEDYYPETLHSGGS
jgi:hypothetical protein